ncbi:MAG: hypothetical protein ABL977_13605, partial [Candidatus Eisenbacteria bacterium]
MLRRWVLMLGLGVLVWSAASGPAVGKRISGRFSFGSTCADTVSVRGVKRYSIPTGASAATFSDPCTLSVVAGRRYLIEMLRPNGGPAGTYARVSFAGTEYFGTADMGAPGVLVSRIFTPAATGTLQVTLSGSAGFGVDIRLTQVAEPTYAVTAAAFQRGSGAPKWQTKSFAFESGPPPTPHVLILTNGNPDGSARTQDTEVVLNGAQVVFPGELTAGMAQLTRDVMLSTSNVLEVKIVSAAGTKVSIKIRATDTSAPTLTVAQPAAVLVTADTAVTSSGVASDAESGATLRLNGQDVPVVGGEFSAALRVPFDGLWN